jgi:L-fuculose-phosphate aldolase
MFGIEMNRAKREIMKIGKALLALNLQNTHSGNISLKRAGKIYITASGTMKGHLKENDIVVFDANEPVETVARASSEARTHRQILGFSRAVIHTHSPNATQLSLVKPSMKPVDFLGKYYLGSVPLVKFESPIASAEMAEKIPEILSACPAMVVRGHGPFVRGMTLPEAMMLACILEDSAMILTRLMLLGVKCSGLINLSYPDAGYPKEFFNPGIACESDTAKRFNLTASDLFSHRISPFHTGSLSEREGRNIWISLRASSPPGFRLQPVRLVASEPVGAYWPDLHLSVYRNSGAGAAIFSHSPQAMIQALVCRSAGMEGIVPDDAEGKTLYPFIPVVSADTECKQVVSLAEKYGLAVMAGFGALSLGKNLSESIHHCSSLENICRLKTGLAIVENLKGPYREK